MSIIENENIRRSRSTIAYLNMKAFIHQNNSVHFEPIWFVLCEKSSKSGSCTLLLKIPKHTKIYKISETFPLRGLLKLEPFSFRRQYIQVGLLRMRAVNYYE